MANAPLSVIDAAEDRAAEPAGPLPPSAVELNLLLDWPDQRARPQWAAVLGASLVLHFFIFLAAIQLPSFIRSSEPERRVMVRHIPLYLPPDVLTQRAPNRQKLSKSIDLADLLAREASESRRASAAPSVKHFEVPKQVVAQRSAEKNPQILPEPPKVALNQVPGPPPVGAVNGLPAAASAPPPAPSPGPFQNIGSEAPPNPHPTLAPPKTTVQDAISGVSKDANSRKLTVSDDNQSEPAAGAAGAINELGAAPHAAVELQSDPQGADFKPYLTRILAIVRANWRRVIPESARMGLLRGRTVLEFVIDRNGSIPKLVTADSSGSEPLDRAAVAGLSMSNPLPPLPADYKGFQVRLAFTFSYNVPSK